MANEIWKDIPGYEGLYQASNHGRVKSLDRIIVNKKGFKRSFKGRIIAPEKIWSGYLSLSLCKNGKVKNYSVQRLILKTFRPIENCLIFQANHINGIRCDNRLENLEWCTASENNKHSFEKLNRKPNKPWLGVYGENNPSSKPVIQKDLNGNIIARYNSSIEAAKVLNVNDDTISRASRKERKTAYGYIWEREIR